MQERFPLDPNEGKQVSFEDYHSPEELDSPEWHSGVVRKLNAELVFEIFSSEFERLPLKSEQDKVQHAEGVYWVLTRTSNGNGKRMLNAALFDDGVSTERHLNVWEESGKDLKLRAATSFLDGGEVERCIELVKDYYTVSEVSQESSDRELSETDDLSLID